METYQGIKITISNVVSGVTSSKKGYTQMNLSRGQQLFFLEKRSIESYHLKGIPGHDPDKSVIPCGVYGFQRQGVGKKIWIPVSQLPILTYLKKRSKKRKKKERKRGKNKKK